jgi:hypothetical protein
LSHTRMFEFSSSNSNVQSHTGHCWNTLSASPPTLSLWPCKIISRVLITNFFPTPPIKLKLGLQVGSRLLISTHLDQSNYLTNRKQGAVNKYELDCLCSSSSLPGGFTLLDWWTSSKISSAGLHTER